MNNLSLDIAIVPRLYQLIVWDAQGEVFSDTPQYVSDEVMPGFRKVLDDIVSVNGECAGGSYEFRTL